MPRAKKTWGEKMKAKPPHHVILEKDFAGIPKGSKLHISCPVEIAAELKTITPGSTMSIPFRHSGIQAQTSREKQLRRHVPSLYILFSENRG
jgi:hypothetical protein